MAHCRVQQYFDVGCPAGLCPWLGPLVLVLLFSLMSSLLVISLECMAFASTTMLTAYSSHFDVNAAALAALLCGKWRIVWMTKTTDGLEMYAHE